MININVCRPYNIRFKKYPPILASSAETDEGAYEIIKPKSNLIIDLRE